MGMPTMKIVGMGAMNIDHFYGVDNILADDESGIVAYESFPGGSAANTIYGLTKLGIKTGFIGAVGNDKFGKLLLRDLDSMGVETAYIKIKRSRRTGETLCLTDIRGRRAIYVSPGANAMLQKRDLPLDYIERANFIHLSSFIDEKQLNLQKCLVDAIASSPVKISFAPGAVYARRGLNALKPILRRTDILFLNRQEVSELTGKHFRAGAQDIIATGPRMIAVTLGIGVKEKIEYQQLSLSFENGSGILPFHKLQRYPLNNNNNKEQEEFTFACYLTDGNREYVVETTPEKVKDSTGAGDAFAAGFLFGLLKNKTIEECGLLGDVMASFVIREVGARKGMPSLSQLSQMYFMRSGYQL